jgi:hypothetical protein
MRSRGRRNGDTIARFALGLDEEALAEGAVARAQGAVKVELPETPGDRGERSRVNCSVISAMDQGELAALQRRADRRAAIVHLAFSPRKRGRTRAGGTANLTKLIEALEGLDGPEDGLALVGAGRGVGGSRVERCEAARVRAVDRASAAWTGPEAQRLWSEAIAAIEASPKYGGLTIDAADGPPADRDGPRLGLVGVRAPADGRGAGARHGRPSRADRSRRAWCWC